MDAKKFVVGAATAAVLVVSGGAVAFAQQDTQGVQGQGRPAAQEQPANPRGAERDCPWEERQGVSGETEV